MSPRASPGLGPAPAAADSVLSAIGATPMVWLRRLIEPGRVAVKLEGLSPTGSLKDRIAFAMVEAAERDGRLRPGTTIVESSSGNFGISMAMVCAVKGYPLIVFLPAFVSMERRQIMRALGADVRPVEGGSDAAWDEADKLAAADPQRYARLHQYANEDNPRCHYETTGPEIWEQMGGRVEGVVCAVGSTGTIVGVGRYLKERNPRCRVVCAQPDAPRHRQQGVRNLSTDRIPPVWDPSVVDETIRVSDADAWRTAQELARLEGLFVGVSSGTAVWAALRLAGRLEGPIAVVLPDRGERYLTSGVFDGGAPGAEGPADPSGSPRRWDVSSILERFHRGIDDPEFRRFFGRDPERAVPVEPGAIVSPADGILEVRPRGERLELIVHIGLMDVHVQRVPLHGVVRSIERGKAGYLSTRSPEHYDHNFQVTTHFLSPIGPYSVRQIAGLHARRIRVFVEPGDQVPTGARLGRILFGSTAVLDLPATVEVAAEDGSKVLGGETILARHRALPPPTA